MYGYLQIRFMQIRLTCPVDVWWSDDITQTRFIPYSEHSLLENFEPESERLAPPESALARAPPPYNRWSASAGAATDKRLAFMRNRHVAFNCWLSVMPAILQWLTSSALQVTRIAQASSKASAQRTRLSEPSTPNTFMSQLSVIFQ